VIHLLAVRFENEDEVAFAARDVKK